MELLIGCGHNREKKVSVPELPKEWSKDLITLDWNESTEPDVVHDLNILPYPFDHDMFDEIHAYEVLEHVGTQGDFRFFFQRIISPEMMTFLNQRNYEMPAEESARTDYRFCYQADFELVNMQELDNIWCFAMRAVKGDYKPEVSDD
jgi:2-polyprenyl-3-methyl-5-hydroxy-6-metoxy-1,4-benzoquinol methylase